MTVPSGCRNALLALCLVACATASAQAPAPRPDPARGQQIAAGACAACHGPDGNSALPANPRLNGQHAEYLVKQLQDYALPADHRAARVNAIMAGFAATLTPEDRRHVAAWYAAQKPMRGEARVRDTLELGQRIYRAGIPERKVPACAGCHAPNGAGIPSRYPRVGGQHAEYTAAQLRAFRDGTRRNDLSMAQIAARLSEAEIKAVSDFIAGLR